MSERLRRALYTCVHCLALLHILCVGVSEEGEMEEGLLKELFQSRGYQRLARPAAHENEAVNVQFSISLGQIIDVDEKNEMFHTNLWLTYTWQDYKLRWNESEYGGVKTIVIPPDMLWTPDILLYNSADEDIDSKFPSNILISSDGTCKWIPPGLFISTCSIDIRWFPFDDQMCRLKFGSWSYDGLQINLTFHAPPVNLNEYVPNGEWDLLGVHAKRNEKRYVCCDEPYIDLTFFVHMSRRSLYYVFNLVMPCCLISALILLTFILPSGEGEKIGLGITILLSLSVFQLIVADIVPATSLAVPLIGVYFTGAMTMCTISIIMTVFVLNLHHRTPDIYVMPPWIQKGVCVWLAGLLRMSRPGKETGFNVKVSDIPNLFRRKSRVHERSRSADVQGSRSRDEPWTRMFSNGVASQTCRIYRNMSAEDETKEMVTPQRPLPGEPCAHSHIYVTYSGGAEGARGSAQPETHLVPTGSVSAPPISHAWTLHTPSYISSHPDPTDISLRLSIYADKASDTTSSLPGIEPIPSPLESTSYTNQQQAIANGRDKEVRSGDEEKESRIERDLRDICRELKYITESMREEKEQSEETNDWMFAANVIDRLCFWVFSAFLALLTIVVFSVAPSPRTIDEHLSTELPP